MVPSMSANHIAMRCGWPDGPREARTAVRWLARNTAISASLIATCDLWFMPMAHARIAHPGGATALRPGRSAGWLEHVARILYDDRDAEAFQAGRTVADEGLAAW